MMYSIGEFSRITQLTIKALRLYHEKGLLIPDVIDDETGYRFYHQAAIEKARVILKLKQLQFSLIDIKNILNDHQADEDILFFLEKHQRKIEQQYLQLKNIRNSIDQIIMVEKEVKMSIELAAFEVEEKTVEDILVASIRYKGKYDECGQYLSQLGKAFGRHICGKALNIYHDNDYREENADIETCFPIKKGSSKDNIEVKKLNGGRVISLIHKGSYDTLSVSYSQIMAYLKEKQLEQTAPIREHYLKGPGMIFKGNPKNYLTEIQIPIAE